MKLENEDKIKEIRRLLINELQLIKYLDKEEFTKFCVNITNSLRYNRRMELLNKDINYIKKLVNNLCNFFDNVGMSRIDLINAISNNIELIEISSKPDFIDKYVLLSVIEDSNNSKRKQIIIDNSRILKKSIKEIYARYCLLKEYNKNITVSSVVGASYNEFMNLFVRKSYYNDFKKPLSHKISIDELIDKYPIDYKYIFELRKLDINKNVVFSKNISNLSKEEKINYVINNYNKFNNIGELSKYSGISSSSIQRYLKEDAKLYTNSLEYKKIEIWLNNAKKEGLSRGGVNSQIYNGYSKDEVGRFNGNKKR